MYEWNDILSKDPPNLKQCFLMTLSGKLFMGAKPIGQSWITAPAGHLKKTDPNKEPEISIFDPLIIWTLFPEPDDMINVAESLPVKDGLYIVWDNKDDVVPYTIAEFRTDDQKFFLNNGEPYKSNDFLEWEISDVLKWANLPNLLSTEEIRKYMSNH